MDCRRVRNVLNTFLSKNISGFHRCLHIGAVEALRLLSDDMAKKGEGSVKHLKIEPQIKIQNIVVSSDLNASIDLFSLSKNVREVDYEPEQFPGAIFRIKEPKAVIILFKNGKLICTGASSTKNIRIVLEKAAKVISKYVLD